MAAVISRPGNCKRESSGRLMREFGDSFHATRPGETGRVADSRTGPSASQFQGAGDDGRPAGAAAARLSRGRGNIGKKGVARIQAMGEMPPRPSGGFNWSLQHLLI